MSQGFVVNSVFLVGNLTRDPELKYLNSGIPVAKLGLAVNNRIKRGDEWQDDPLFVDVTVFGKRAEQVSEGLDKGMRILVEGRLQYRSWEKDGQKHNKIEVVADIIEKIERFDNVKSSREPGSDDGDNFARPRENNRYRDEHGEREVPF